MIPVNVQLRIAKIQAIVREERAVAADLESKLTGPESEVRKLLRLLDNVDAQLVPSILNHPPRDEGQWSSWLAHVERVLAIAIQYREQATGLVAKDGT